MQQVSSKPSRKKYSSIPQRIPSKLALRNTELWNFHESAGYWKWLPLSISTDSKNSFMRKAINKFSTRFLWENQKFHRENHRKEKKKTQRKSKSFYLTLQNSQEKTHSRVYFNKYTGFTCVTLKTTHYLILFSTYFLNFPYANPKIVSKRQCFQNCSRYLFLVLSVYLWIIPHSRPDIGA